MRNGIKTVMKQIQSKVFIVGEDSLTEQEKDIMAAAQRALSDKMDVIVENEIGKNWDIKLGHFLNKAIVEGRSLKVYFEIMSRIDRDPTEYQWLQKEIATLHLNEILDGSRAGVYSLFRSHHIQIIVNTITKEIVMVEVLFRNGATQSENRYVMNYSVADLGLFDTVEVQKAPKKLTKDELMNLLFRS